MFKKVIDCVPFFKDFDLYEIRLNALAPYVERFVVLESPLTLQNKPKPLFFKENMDRFKGFNIQHIVYEPKDSASPMERAWHQLRHMINSVDVAPETMLFVSDGDEIPNINVWDGQEGSFAMETYFYRFNLFSRKCNWHGTRAILKKTLNKTDIMPIRRSRTFGNIWSNGGWHFNCLGTIEDIIYKYESNGHEIINTPEHLAQIRENYKNMVHPIHLVPFGMHIRPKKLVVKTPAGPEWLLQNRDKYKHLFYDGGVWP